MLIRVYIGIKTPVYIIADSAFDDYLMIRYAALGTHFHSHDMLSLVKTMSYPVFLAVSHTLGLTYRFSIALLWIVAALVIMYALHRFTLNKVALTLIFTFILFSPLAFDSDVGLRVYRNAILVPCALITIGLMLHLLIGVLLKDRLRKNVLISIALGLAFFFYYYIKEDSIYMMPLLILVMLSCLALWFYQAKSRPDAIQSFFRVFWVALIPLVFFVVGTNAYKAVNYKYFGVYEIVTRNEGVFGDFAERVIKIEDPEKTYIVWVSYSTVQKIWTASPHLQAHPELMDDLVTNTWGGDLKSNQIRADHFFWKFRMVLANNGFYENEKKAEDFLSEVNADLDAAINSGELKLFEGRFYISNQAPGRTGEEILALRPLVIEGIRVHLMYEGYSSTDNNTFREMTPELIRQNNDANINHADYMLNENLDKPDAFNEREFSLFLGIANMICQAYRILAYPIVLLSILGTVFLFVRLIRKKASSLDVFTLCTILVCLGYALLIIFGIAWWGEWFPGVMRQYAVPAAAFFQIAEVFALLYGARLLKEWILLIKPSMKSRRLMQIQKGRES